LVTNSRKNELIKDRVLKKLKYDYALDMSTAGCPSLKDSLCMIHKNPKRPRVCKEFPLFIEKNFIRLSPGCPAVIAEKLYPFISLLLAEGLKLK